MNQYQQTIQRSATLSGIGLHTGKTTNLTLLPAPPHTGIVFIRTDIENNPHIPAQVEFVTQTQRSTTIEKNGATVITIEHLLAAITGLQIDNIYIEIDNEEIPILDGSAQPFVETLIHAGLEAQTDAPRTILTLSQPFTYTDAQTGSEYLAIPDNQFSLTTLIDFKAPSVGKQHATLQNITHFADQIAPARTFCLLSEVEMLLAQNLIKGASLENAIVYTDLQPDDQLLQKIAQYASVPQVAVHKEGYLNNVTLHFDNEAARHKLLDVLGDLTLLGAPLQARIFATKPGHAANVRFAQELKKHFKKLAGAAIPHYDPNVPPLYDVVGVQQLLPHRPPFLLIDKILSLTKQKVVGVKNVTMNEPFFIGHFPGHPVMPGVLLIEAMAQVGGILVMQTVPDPENHLTFFLKIENARFRKPVVPGDTVIFELTLTADIRRGLCEMDGVAYVGNKLVADAHLVAQISRRTR